MKLQSEFTRLPFQFDAEKLQEEVSKLNKTDWMAHPNNLPGNFSCPLISTNGKKNDLMFGEMLQTPTLDNMPYTKQVMQIIGEVYGRSRLMLLKAGCQVSPHSDLHYHWYNRVRIHIPIITNKHVIFKCASKQVNMPAGSTWIFDSWKNHSVYNNSNYDRIHLVLDTCGSFDFWKLIERLHLEPLESTPEKYNYRKQNVKSVIKTEKYNSNQIMHPGEVDYLTQTLILDAQSFPNNNPEDLKVFSDTLHRFKIEWRTTWLLYGNQPNSLHHFKKIVQRAEEENYNLILNSNGANARSAFFALLLGVSNEAIKILIDKKSSEGNDAGKKPTHQYIHNSAISKSRNSPCSCGSNKKYKYCCGIQ